MPDAPASPEPTPVPDPRSQFLRRDFLVGAAGGVAASAAAGLAAWNAAPPSVFESRLPFGTTLSYAQNGEDLVAASLYRVIRRADIQESDPDAIYRGMTYLDIGAFVPIYGNNTYYFYRKGGRGVLVEPNVDLTPLLKKERTRDTVLTAGIGTGDVAEADYYVTTLPQLNTFDKAAADRVPDATWGQHKVVRVVKMQLLDVNRVIAENFGGAAPDYLSIDAEGLDMAILGTLNFGKYRPAIVCAEHSQLPDERKKLLDLMAANGYTPRGQTYPNTLFVDDRRFG